MNFSAHGKDTLFSMLWLNKVLWFCCKGYALIFIVLSINIAIFPLKWKLGCVNVSDKLTT